MTRHPLILTAIASVLALSACGGSDGDSGATAGSSRQDKAYEGALKFAKCMREHGVDMPDPQRDAKGGIRITQSRRAGDGMTDAKMQAAQKDCDKYMEAGGSPVRDPAMEARMQDALFAYAKCMRSHGIDMPDPQVSGGKVTMKVGSGGGKGEQGRTGGDPETPAFKAADKACHHHLAELETIRQQADDK
jgi:hypothetical protein